MTKKDFEYIGDLNDFLKVNEKKLNEVKGEFVVSIYRPEQSQQDLLPHYNKCLPESVTGKDRVESLRKLTGLPKSFVYDWVHRKSRS